MRLWKSYEYLLMIVHISNTSPLKSNGMLQRAEIRDPLTSAPTSPAPVTERQGLFPVICIALLAFCFAADLGRSQRIPDCTFTPSSLPLPIAPSQALDIARRFTVARLTKCCAIMGRKEGSLTAAQILPTRTPPLLSPFPSPFPNFLLFFPFPSLFPPPPLLCVLISRVAFVCRLPPAELASPDLLVLPRRGSKQVVLFLPTRVRILSYLSLPPFFSSHTPPSSFLTPPQPTLASPPHSTWTRRGEFVQLFNAPNPTFPPGRYHHIRKGFPRLFFLSPEHFSTTILCFPSQQESTIIVGLFPPLPSPPPCPRIRCPRTPSCSARTSSSSGPTFASSGPGPSSDS